MKLKKAQFCAALAAITLLPTGTLSARAATFQPATLEANDASAGQATLQPVDWDDRKRFKLRHAYWLLEQADKDYRGHREAAMKQIKKAGEMMRLDLHGDGWGGEKQRWSDERLREARGLLEDIVDKGGRREHEHIRAAIRELNKALEIR
jgi:hypothetical protein